MQFKGPEGAAKWLALAVVNLEEAQAATDAGRYTMACYHSQQAAEIGLKSLFILNGIDFKFEHSVVVLLNSLKSNYSELGGYSKEAATLTVYAVTTRYPDLETGISPLDTIMEENAVTAVQYAEKILETCQRIYGQAVLGNQGAKPK